MTQQDFTQLLRENFETKFKFTKKDGTEREARGTLNFDMIPEESTRRELRHGKIPRTSLSIGILIRKYGVHSVGSSLRS